MLSTRALSALLIASLAGCGSAGGGSSAGAGGALASSSSGGSLGGSRGGSSSGGSLGGGSTSSGSVGGSTSSGGGSTAAISNAHFTVSSPAPASFLSGAAQINVNGTCAAGVARIEVNGAAATIASGAWTLGVTLSFGINTFQVRALDATGSEVAHTSWSVMFSPTYLPANQLVRNSAEVRLSQKAIAQITPLVLQQIAGGSTLQAAAAGAIGQSAGGFTINSLNFGNPSVTPTLVQGGIEAAIDLPSLAVDATFAVISAQITASNVHIDATLDVTVANGLFAATMPTAPTVQLSNFRVSGAIGGALGGTLQPLVEQAIATAIQSILPTAVTNALNGATQPHSITMAGYTATVDDAPESLAIDPTNLRASGDANVTVAGPATATAVNAPGSPSRNGASAAAPALTAQHDVSLCVREDLINRVLYAGWASGAGTLRIDQAWLAAQGVNLPFPLDASVLVPFFPALASLHPNGGPIPVAFELGSLLPPTVQVTGAPTLLVTQFGEFRMGVQLDLGQGFVDVLTLSVSGEVGTTATLSGNQLQLGLAQPVQFTIDLLANPFGLSIPDVNRFVNAILPTALGYAGGLIPAIQIPALPGGLQPKNLDIRQDGAGGDYLTIEGDL